MYTPLHTSSSAIIFTSEALEIRTHRSNDLPDRAPFSHWSGTNQSSYSGSILSCYLSGEHQANTSLSVKAHENASLASHAFGVSLKWTGQDHGCDLPQRVCSITGDNQFFIEESSLFSEKVHVFNDIEDSSLSSSLFSFGAKFSSDEALNPEFGGGYQHSVIGADKSTQAWVSGPLARGPT